MGELLAQSLPPPHLGLDTEASPERIDGRKAPVVENFLTGRDGRLVMRGPVRGGGDELVRAAAEDHLSYWTFNDTVAIARRTKSGTASREPWVAPYRKAAAATDLADVNTTIEVQNLNTGATTSIPAVATGAVPGPRFDRLGANVYGISYDTATAEVNENGGYQKLTHIVRWNGGTVAGDFVAYTNAPRGAQDVKSYLNRLFVLGGRNPDGTGEIKFNTLWWSDLGGPTTDTLAMWQDDVSGLVNQIEVDSDDRNDFGVALAKIPNGLVIFKRYSMHILWGSTPAMFSLRTFSNEIGCLDARSVIEYADGVFFLSDRGYMFFDGSQLVNVSDSIRYELDNTTRLTVGRDGTDGGQAWATKLPNNHIGLCLSTSDPLAATLSNQVAYIYHTPSRSWSKFSTNGIATGSTIPSEFIRSKQWTWLFNSRVFTPCNEIMSPETALEAARGVDLVTQTARIPAKWHSKLFKLSSPQYKTQLHRLLLDYKFQIDGAADDANNGWFVSLIGGDGTTLLAEFQVPAQGDPGSYLYRRRASKDVLTECTDVQLRVEWKDSGGTYPAVIAAELYDTVVEFQRTRLRASS